MRALNLILSCLIVATPASAEDLAAVPQVGIFLSPCEQVPGPPPNVASFLEQRKAAAAAGKALPTPTREYLAELDAWRATVRLADFAELCRYEADNRNLPAASPQRIVFMGDSVTEGWKVSRPFFFAGDRIDRGISGQTTDQMILRFYADVIALKPSTVHILAGTNDIAGNTGPTSLSRVQNNIKVMVEMAKAHHIRAILGTVLPVRQYGWRPAIKPVPSITALNDWMRSYAREQRITLIDYYKALDDGQHGLLTGDSSDGVHPNAAGYAKMEAVLRNELDDGKQASAAR